MCTRVSTYAVDTTTPIRGEGCERKVARLGEGVVATQGLTGAAGKDEFWLWDVCGIGEKIVKNGVNECCKCTRLAVRIEWLVTIMHIGQLNHIPSNPQGMASGWVDCFQHTKYADGIAGTTARVAR